MDDDLDRELRALASEERRRQGEDHPAPDVLLDYQEGLLPDDERERLRDHLAVCRSCAEVVLDLADFPDLAAGEGFGEAPKEAEVEAAWQRFRTRSRAEEAVAQVATRAPRALWTGYALAAAFFLTTVGLSVWIALHRDGGGAGLESDVAVVSLVPAGETHERGGPSSIQEVRFPAWADTIYLSLASLRSAEGGSLHYRLLDEGGEVLGQGELHPDEFGSLGLLLPRELLAPGTYRIVVRSARGEPDEAPTTYRFRLLE